MAKFIYWRSYNRPFQILFWILVILFLALAVGIIAIQIIGVENLIPWNVLTQESSYLQDFRIFSKGPFSFSIPAQMKVLTEFFGGGSIPAVIQLTGPLLVAMLIGMVLYLTLVTFFKRTWYLLAMAGFLGFLVLLNIESIALFGWTDIKGLIVVFVILLTPSYYLHAFDTSSGLIKRLWVIGTAFLILIGLSYFFGESDYGLSSIFGYALLGPYVLIILFILTVAHEIIASFVTLITGTSGLADSTKLRHFLGLSLIYLVNILLSYLYIAHYIDWQLIYINPFVLFIVSSILGIWGSRARASLYVGASGLEALWPILYLVMGVVSMATLTYLMLSVNDPMLKVLSDLSIYAHLGVGFAFLLYIIYNFLPLIEKGQDIKAVLYNPTNLPYVTNRLLGVVIIVALFAVRGFDYPTWYALGGYSNANADIELSIGHRNVSEAYFRNGNSYAYHNHKSNYNLAMMLQKDNPSEAIEHLEWSLDQMPTAQAVINKANIENRKQEFYQALFTLQEGNKLIAGNEQIQNNLARQFEKVKILDSAEYYYDLAGPANKQVKNNRLGLTAQHKRSLGADSANWLKNLDRVGVANASALGYFDQIPELTSANHMFDMVLLNNWLIMNSDGLSFESLDMAKTAIDSTSNSDYHDQLLYSWSLASFSFGRTTDAIEGLAALMYGSTEWADKAQLALGRLYLQLNSYDQAINILLDANKGEIDLDIAVAYLEYGTPEKAEEFWQLAAQQEGSFIGDISAKILSVVYSEKPTLDDDQAKYLYLRYNKYLMDESEQNSLLNTINDKNLRIDLAIELAKFHHEFDNPGGAALMLKNIAGLGLGLNEYKRYIILDALINNNDENVQNQLVEYDSIFGFKSDETLLENTLNHLAGMELDSTDYVQLATTNPFFPDAILIGIDFLKSYPDSFDASNYLAKAVQMNPESPKLLREYILLALDMGMDQFAENALAEFAQRFSGQAYMVVKLEYDMKKIEIEKQLEEELN